MSGAADKRLPAQYRYDLFCAAVVADQAGHVLPLAVLIIQNTREKFEVLVGIQVSIVFVDGNANS